MIQSNPEILLIDEIFAVGDKDFKPKCISVFQRYKKQGKTIIFSSHSLDTIEKYCDRVIFLKNGEVADIGEPKSVVKKYKKS